MQGDGPENSFASETRKLTRQDRVRVKGKGPSGFVLLGVALVLVAALVWIALR